MKALGRRDEWVTLGTVGGPFQQTGGFQISNVLDVDGRLFLFDVGNGVLRQLAISGRTVERVEAVFVTHLHPDHVADLALVIVTRWLSRATEPLQVFGPAGTGELVDGIVASYAPVERASSDGEAQPLSLRQSVTTSEVQKGGHGLKHVHEADGLRVEAADVDHFRSPESSADDQTRPHAIGFRVRTPSRTIAYTGDTGASRGIDEIAADVDLLVSEVVDLEAMASRFASMPLPVEVRERLVFNMTHNHISPDSVLAAAIRSRVERVLLTHLVPAVTPETRAERVERLVSPWVAAGIRHRVDVAVDLGSY